jgi:hypothetical protein
MHTNSNEWCNYFSLVSYFFTTEKFHSFFFSIDKSWDSTSMSVDLSTDLTRKNLLFPSHKPSWKYRGWILGRNPDKSPKSFPPCYSQSHLRVCLEISNSSNTRIVLGIFTVQLLYTVQRRKEENLIENIPPSLWFKTSIQIHQVRTFKIMPRNLNEIVHSWILLLDYWYCVFWNKEIVEEK